MRVGRVIRTVPDRSFGFIQADEFREDVFFHFSVVDRDCYPDRWEFGQEVEFEINEILRIDEKRLQATQVRVARRPLVHKLDELAESERRFKAKHHPRSRQSKPKWRLPRETSTQEEGPSESESSPS